MEVVPFVGTTLGRPVGPPKVERALSRYDPVAASL